SRTGPRIGTALRRRLGLHDPARRRALDVSLPPPRDRRSRRAARDRSVAPARAALADSGAGARLRRRAFRRLPLAVLRQRAPARTRARRGGARRPAPSGDRTFARTIPAPAPRRRGRLGAAAGR